MRRRALLLATASGAVATIVPLRADAQANPHGGGAPAGHGRGQTAGYQPPEDVVSPSPDIPAGTVVVRLVDADDKPVPNADVTLDVLHQSVAQGDKRESLRATTTEEGFAKFDDLKVGTGHSYTARATYQGGDFFSSAFGLTAEGGGVAVILHVFQVSTQLADTMVFTPDARVFLSLKEDVIVVQVEALLANPSPTAWLADHLLVMPSELKAFSGEEDAAPAVIGAEGGVRIRGTVRPGGAVIRFRFHVPHHDEADVELPLSLPPRTTRVMIAAEASKKMGLSADGFPKEAERVKDRGRTLLRIDKQWTPQDGESFLSKVNVKLTGLPTKGMVPYAAAFASVATAGGALAYVIMNRKKTGPLAADTREDLLEAKEAMLQEIAMLERAHRSGEVGPRAYDRIRKAMLDALARIIDRLEAAGPLPETAPAAPAARATVTEDADAEPRAPEPTRTKKRRKKARPAAVEKAPADKPAAEGEDEET
jgi:hypothetical protein